MPSVGDDGQREAETENIAFAERIARLHLKTAGAGAPPELAMAYGGFTQPQRNRRRRAKAIEEKATAARDARDFDEAIRLFTEAMTIYNEIDDRRSVAILWGSIGAPR